LIFSIIVSRNEKASSNRDLDLRNLNLIITLIHWKFKFLKAWFQLKLMKIFINIISKFILKCILLIEIYCFARCSKPERCQSNVKSAFRKINISRQYGGEALIFQSIWYEYFHSNGSVFSHNIFLYINYSRREWIKNFTSLKFFEEDIFKSFAYF
jgi:hypothetical protein